MNKPSDLIRNCFDRYAKALMARDAATVAEMYGVPGLVAFPGQVIAVSDKRQTEEFFESSWEQYEGVDDIAHDIAIMGQAPGVVWADVTWSYDGKSRERFCYQLLESEDGYSIVVLTPMEIPTQTK